jgi:asparagine synthase (glutamine-hydrolysing)
MCGIAGILGRPGSANSRAPLEALAHRGPDDSGWVTHQAHFASPRFHSTLLHRRLSILDLSTAGHQPMASADGACTIVFNGEIYNYRELRAELQSLGRVFHTHTDTEVLLEAYIHWGRDCLRRLIGMFAFAVEDRTKGTLFLARDFFGIKPLYYVRDVLPSPPGRGAGGEGVFAFASEIKALLDWLPLKRTIDPQRLYDYLRFGRTDDGADTLFAEIKQVPAAHYLEVPLDRPDQGEPVRYWKLPDEAPINLSFDAAAQRVRELFLDNIRLHLRSDVPVGTALSGGIDSSAIVCAMRAVEPSAEIHAFSYIADDPAMSEERWVDLVGAHTGAIVHKVRAHPDDLVAELDRLIHTQDEPFGSTSIYAQHRVFRLAQEHGIKVMLDGQGADEMLAGYPQHRSARLASLVRRGRLLAAHRLASGRLHDWTQAAKRLLPGVASRWLYRCIAPSWLNASWFKARGVRIDALAPTARLHDELRQTLTLTSLPMLLRYEDRNSMASSIESRVPFLTPALAEFLLSLPEQFLLGDDGTSKNVFRAAMRGIVPDVILDRRDKIGFATPEERWLKTLRPWIDTTLTSDRARSIPALNVDAMQHDWKAVLDGRARFDFRIWRWVNLIRWAEKFDVKFGEW